MFEGYLARRTDLPQLRLDRLSTNRARMTDPYKPNEDLSLWQAAAIALVEYACGYEHGRSKDDLVYHEVTEGRDTGLLRVHYSSCGDLPHWLLERFGLGGEQWVNRASLKRYRVRANISALASSPISSAPSGADWRPEPGDILISWSDPLSRDAHACVALDVGRVGNYGAGGMSAASWPGANITTPPLSYANLRWMLGHRQVHRIIRLADAIRLAKRPPNLTGAKLPGEVIDALQATWSE